MVYSLEYGERGTASMLQVRERPLPAMHLVADGHGAHFWTFHSSRHIQRNLKLDSGFDFTKLVFMASADLNVGSC